MVSREGYYDYMLRRTREENTTLIKFKKTNNPLKQTIQQMQEEIHHLQMRVKELSEDNYRLKEQNANIHNN
jgi:TolA-binding protein